MLDSKTLKKGEEQSEAFTMRGKTYYQYDYRDADGELFSCVREDLDECRKIVRLQLVSKCGTPKEVR